LTGLAVMFGWFVAAAAVLVYWVSLQSGEIPEADCDPWCSSDQFDAALAAVVIGVPSAVVGLFVGALVLGWLVARHPRSGFVTGSVAGLAGLVAGPALVFCALSTWGTYA